MATATESLEAMRKRLQNFAKEQVILKMMEDNGGELTATDLVNAAAEPEHPLHHLFDWDNDSAADQWRLQQARNLISSIKVRAVIHPEDDRGPISVRVPIAVSPHKTRFDDGGYHLTGGMNSDGEWELSDTGKYEMLNDLRVALDGLKRRYKAPLLELDAIETIDSVQDSLLDKLDALE